MQDYFKIFGSEVLYLLASVIVAGLATLLQIAGRSYEGDHSSFIWAGSEYRYNVFFYILGMIVFMKLFIYVALATVKNYSMNNSGLVCQNIKFL